MAVGALDGCGLGSEAHKWHAVGIRSDSILRAKAGGLVLRGTICVGLAVGLSLGLNLGLGLLLVDRRGNALLVLNRLAWLRRDNLTGGLGGDVAHLVLGTGGLNYWEGTRSSVNLDFNLQKGRQEFSQQKSKFG